MAIGQGGYKGNLEEIMDSLGPQSGGGQFFEDFLDHKQNKQIPLDPRQDLEARYNDYLATQNPSLLERAALNTAITMTDVGENVYDFTTVQAPEFLSDMWGFLKEGYTEPRFEGHVPWLDATGVVPVVDTALTLGSAFLTGAVSGLEGTARGFSLDESGSPPYTWSGADAADAIEHRAANFPSYHPKTRMGRDVESGIGALMEGWTEHVAHPAGRFAQSAIEWAGGDKETATHVGGITTGSLSALPALAPFLRKSKVSSNKPMFKGGFSVKELRLALDDKLVVANDFQFISDAWRRIDPEAWRVALDDGTFGAKIQQIMDVVSQDLRDTALFIADESVVRSGERGTFSAREGIPEVWKERIYDHNVPWYKNRTWYGRKKGEVKRTSALKHPKDLGKEGAGGYMSAGRNLHFPTFTRDAQGRMLPNWGRSYPEGTYVRQRYNVIDKKAFQTKEGLRDAIVHEWEHVLDDILYYRLAGQSKPIHPPVSGMPFDYAGEQRFIRDVRRPGTSYGPVMSDLSPVLNKLSENVVEARWRRYLEEEAATPTIEGALTRKEYINDVLWRTKSPQELRARLVPINDYLALHRRKTYDKLQNPITRKMTVEDLWQIRDLPYSIRQVLDVFDDMVTYDVMTRAEATAALKDALAEVRQPYGKTITEVKVGPGPGLLNGGEE